MLNLQSIYFGQKHPSFDYKDFDIVKKISRLARKHHRQCENDCNGEGYIKSVFYRCDNEKAYIGEDTVFYLEIGKIEFKIRKTLLVANDKQDKWRFEFQHDPRGATVKLYYEGDYIEL